MKYGYGQVTIKANYLKYEIIKLPVGKIVDTWYIIKDKDFNENSKISLEKKELFDGVEWLFYCFVSVFLETLTIMSC